MQTPVADLEIMGEQEHVDIIVQWIESATSLDIVHVGVLGGRPFASFEGFGLSGVDDLLSQVSGMPSDVNSAWQALERRRLDFGMSAAAVGGVELLDESRMRAAAELRMSVSITVYKAAPS